MPYSLSEEQIDFILADIKKRGIEIEKLQINLLDHICCLLEEKMNEGDDFETGYKAIIEDFHENGMKGLQKETKAVLRSKHYYKIRGAIYIIFIASLSYNALGIIKMVKGYFEQKRLENECYIIKDATLEEGYKLLQDKIKEKYPDKKIQDYICINFIDHPSLIYPEGFILDPSFFKHWETSVKYHYRDYDKLAGSYPNVTFVAAFQRTDEKTNNLIKKYSAETSHLLYINGLNRLHSGLQDSNVRRTRNVIQSNINDPCILDKNGNIVFTCKYPTEDIFFTNNFLRRLPK
jgi:hypothetical protein